MRLIQRFFSSGRLLTAFAIFVTVTLSAVAQEINWTVRIVDQETDHPALQLTAKVPSGGHFYAMDNPQHDGNGANPLSFTITPIEGCVLDGGVQASKTPVAQYDDVYKMEQRFYTGTVVFTQRLKPTDGNFKVKVKVRGQFCIGKQCMVTRLNEELSGKGKVSAKAPEVAKSQAGVQAEEKKSDDPESASADIAEEEKTIAEELLSEADSVASADSTAVADTTEVVGSVSDTWRNVEGQMAALKSGSAASGGSSMTLLGIFIAGFLAGFLALLTPCVWPMIPMTVSFFLKQNKTRAKSVRMASLYGLSIIVIYVAIGLAVTLIFGATALNKLATSAVFNLIFFALLVVFAISFLGGFEMTLPSKWTNRIDEKADSTSGLLSIFFMAFTLSLVSFSCTGPIIGTLLVEAASSGSIISPTLGMLGFATALAIPFTLFAMFPSWLKSMPKSGGWLNSVKVVLGFLELALALKFLSVADMAYHWGILDREVFLALWIVIFTLLGVYLLGKLRFPHDTDSGHTGVFPFMLSLISFAFAVYMLPGLWGAPLKAISAFAPPLSTQDFSLYDGEVHPDTEDYDTALELGAREGKPVIVDFSGYGCVNCRKMEGAVWTDDAIRSKIDDEFVLTTLYVDDKRALPKPIEMTDRKGRKVTLEDYGELWSFLQENKFGAVAQPYHVVLDSDGNLLTYPQDFTESTEEYNRFLDSALENYRKKH